MIVAGLSAAALAFTGALWLVARRAARVREVDLGPPPYAALFAADAAAVAVAAPSHGFVALLILLTLVGVTVAAVFDARTGLIPDDLSLATALAALGCAIATGSATRSLAGGLVCGGALLFLYLATRRRGIGFGDVKLAAVIGVGLGPACGLVAVGSAFVIGAGVALVALAAQRLSRGSSLRFGPYLAVGAGCAPLVTSWLIA